MKTPQEYVAGLYCRISSDDGFTDKESNSITTQKQILTRYCNEHGYRVGEIYADDGYTGTNFERPDFKRMLDDIYNGKINMVITKDLSRLGRNHILTGQYTEIIFARYGVRYIAIGDSVDTLYEDNDIAPFKNILNEMYARDISKKQKASAANRAKNGLFCGTCPPYGYIIDPDMKHHLIIDDKTSKVVLHIFDLALTGLGARAIATQLQREAVERPSVRLAELGYSCVKPAKDIYAWPAVTVQSILKDPVYVGTMVGHKRPSVSFQLKKRVKSSEDELVIVENTHEPIVDKEVFDKVQRMLEKRHMDKPLEQTGLLNCYLVCADCGKTLTRSTYKNGHPVEYYSCRIYRDKGKAFCSHHFIDAKAMKQILLDDIREKARLAAKDNGEMLEEICSKSAQNTAGERQKMAGQIAKYRTRLLEIDTVVGKMYEDKVLGKIPEHRFDLMNDKYTKEAEELQTEIDRLESELAMQNEKEVNLEMFKGVIKKYTEIAELTPEILADTLDKVVVHEREKVNGKWKQQLDIHYRFIGLI